MAPRPVRVLSDAVANQIAAGEVVERPASVVKELVENALDAGAHRIKVEVLGGGQTSLRITDDGHGMSEADARLAVTRHATSKLVEARDLDTVSTLGFRGEALPSIASVSRFQLSTAVEGAESGVRVRIEGGGPAELSAAPAVRGTTIEVDDLFFNVPARRKFLKRPPTELAHISDAVTRLALAHPTVGFKLMAEGRSVLDAPPTPEGKDPRPRLARLLGRSVAEGLVEVPKDGVARPIEVHGWIGAPPLSERGARGQYVFVNGRFVKDKTIYQALSEGFRGRLPSGRQPVVVLFLSVRAGEVDVNVHPQKVEVRFAHSGEVFRAVQGAVRRGLADCAVGPDDDADARRRSLGATVGAPAVTEPVRLASSPRPGGAGGGFGAARSGEASRAEASGSSGEDLVAGSGFGASELGPGGLEGPGPGAASSPDGAPVAAPGYGAASSSGGAPGAAPGYGAGGFGMGSEGAPGRAPWTAGYGAGGFGTGSEGALGRGGAPGAAGYGAGGFGTGSEEASGRGGAPGEFGTGSEEAPGRAPGAPGHGAGAFGVGSGGAGASSPVRGEPSAPPGRTRFREHGFAALAAFDAARKSTSRYVAPSEPEHGPLADRRRLMPSDGAMPPAEARPGAPGGDAFAQNTAPEGLEGGATLEGLEGGVVHGAGYDGGGAPGALPEGEASRFERAASPGGFGDGARGGPTPGGFADGVAHGVGSHGGATPGGSDGGATALRDGTAPGGVEGGARGGSTPGGFVVGVAHGAGSHGGTTPGGVGEGSGGGAAALRDGTAPATRGGFVDGVAHGAGSHGGTTPGAGSDGHATALRDGTTPGGVGAGFHGDAAPKALRSGSMPGDLEVGDAGSDGAAAALRGGSMGSHDGVAPNDLGGGDASRGPGLEGQGDPRGGGSEAAGLERRVGTLRLGWLDGERARPLGLMHERYLLLDAGAAMWVVDVAAAAARVDASRPKVAAPRQPLLVPLAIELSEVEAGVVDEARDALDDAGLELRIDGRTALVTAGPSWARGADFERGLRAALAGIVEEGLEPGEALERGLERSAEPSKQRRIRSIEEARAVLAQLERCEVRDRGLDGLPLVAALGPERFAQLFGGRR